MYCTHSTGREGGQQLTTASVHRMEICHLYAPGQAWHC